MIYIKHYKDESWGGNSILFMEETGISFARLYWYDDDPETVYFSDWLAAEKWRQDHGILSRLLRTSLACTLRQ